MVTDRQVEAEGPSVSSRLTQIREDEVGEVPCRVQTDLVWKQVNNLVVAFEFQACQGVLDQEDQQRFMARITKRLPS